jgi:hypothetical protein
MVRPGVSEIAAMRLSGVKTSGVFLRYDITSLGDIEDAAVKIERVAKCLKIDLTPQLAPMMLSMLLWKTA